MDNPDIAKLAEQIKSISKKREKMEKEAKELSKKASALLKDLTGEKHI